MVPVRIPFEPSRERKRADFGRTGFNRLLALAARIALNLTGSSASEQLGERLNLPQSQISRIERRPDHTTVKTLKRIARALGVDVRSLI